jgi:DNA-binding cell septation regulator SpoVG
MAKIFSDLQIRKVNGKTIKASGTVVVANSVKVNFTVMEGSKGLFAKLPSHKGKDDQGTDKWYDDVYITDEDVRKDFQREVLAAFKALDSGTETKKPSSPDSDLPF